MDFQIPTSEIVEKKMTEYLYESLKQSNINISDYSIYKNVMNSKLDQLLKLANKVSLLPGGDKKVFMIEEYQKRIQEFILSCKYIKYGKLEDLEDIKPVNDKTIVEDMFSYKKPFIESRTFISN